MPRRLASLSTWGREGYYSISEAIFRPTGVRLQAMIWCHLEHPRVVPLLFATLTVRLIQTATDTKLRLRVEMVLGSVLVVLARLHVSV